MSFFLSQDLDFFLHSETRLNLCIPLGQKNFAFLFLCKESIFTFFPLFEMVFFPYSDRRKLYKLLAILSLRPEFTGLEDASTRVSLKFAGLGNFSKSQYKVTKYLHSGSSVNGPTHPNITSVALGSTVYLSLFYFVVISITYTCVSAICYC